MDVKPLLKVTPHFTASLKWRHQEKCACQNCIKMKNSQLLPIRAAGIAHYSRYYHLTVRLARCIVDPMKAFLSLVLTIMISTLSSQAAGSLYDIPLKNIDGQDATLKPYAGKVMLIVNVASHCGFTPQYKSLEAVYQKYQPQGLVICGFPCNQFGAQEPGTSEEIKQFCTATYGVSFPMFEKLEVNGPGRHPLYVQLAGKDSPYPGDIGWNFTKFLIGRDGKILARFDSRVKPDSAEVTSAIDAALAAK